MSAYRKIVTKFTNEDALIKALNDVCAQRGGAVESGFSNDLVLYGYQGDARQERAKYVVRRALINPASNDLGFAQRPDGTFEVIISEFDQTSTRYGLGALQQVQERYNYHNAVSLAWSQGYTVTEGLDDRGRTVLTLSRLY